MLKENPEVSGKLHSWIPKIWNAGLPVIDDLHTDSYVWKPEQKTEKFIALLKELKPGVTEIPATSNCPVAKAVSKAGALGMRSIFTLRPDLAKYP